MKIFEYIDRVNLIHKLIKEKRTGTPQQFAKRLNISTSRLYVVLDDLKLKGAPIEYSREIKTYYYRFEFEILIKADFRLLTEKEAERIGAGFSSIFFPTTFFV